MLGISRGARRGALGKHVGAGTATTYAFDSTFDNVLTTHREVETAAVGAGAAFFDAQPTAGTTPQLIGQWTTEPTVAGTQTIAGPTSFTFWGNWVQGGASALAAPALRMELHYRHSSGAEALLATFDSSTVLTGTWAPTTWGGTLSTTVFNENDRLIFRLYLISFGGNAKGGDWCSIAAGAAQSASVTLPGPVNVKVEQVGGGTLLFASGFEANVAFGTPDVQVSQDWVPLVGTDLSTGYTWPMSAWGGSTQFQLLHFNGTTTSAGWTEVALVNGTGRLGTTTRMLRCSLLNNSANQAAQMAGIIGPTSAVTEFYQSCWILLPSNFAAQRGNGGFAALGGEWKSAGDFRVIQNVMSNGTVLNFNMKVDTDANGGVPLVTHYFNTNTSFNVPQGSWFFNEFYTNRGTPGQANGVTWHKVNGTLVHQYNGNLWGINNANINRIFFAHAYGNNTPIITHYDEIEFRSAPP